MTEFAFPTTYSAYWLYRADRGYASLLAPEQQQAQAEFLRALETRDPSVHLRGVYSLVGLRQDADLLIWTLGPDLDAIQRLAVALRHSGLGRHLIEAQTYLGVTAPARYDPEHLPAFLQGAAPKRYLSLYPFTKTAEWYLLAYEQRRDLMAEHGGVGRRYAVPRERLAAGTAGNGHGRRGDGRGATAIATQPAAQAGTETGGGVLASTVDAYGLGDYEFILANESDDPAEITQMMLSLRATAVRRYTKLDTPIYLCRLRTPAEALADL